MLGKESKADLGSRQLNSKGRCRKISAHHLCIDLTGPTARRRDGSAERSVGKDIPLRIDILYITY